MLSEAREALTYWEERAQRLPRRAVRRRREARAMAQRWTARVIEAEHARYGTGAIGVLTLVATEGRLPEPARLAIRRLSRRARQVAIALVVVLAAGVVAVGVATVELLSRLA